MLAKIWGKAVSTHHGYNRGPEGQWLEDTIVSWNFIGGHSFTFRKGITSVGRGNCLKQFKRSLGQDKTKEINIGSVDQLMDDMADLQDEPSAEFCLWLITVDGCSMQMCQHKIYMHLHHLYETFVQWHEQKVSRVFWSGFGWLRMKAMNEALAQGSMVDGATEDELAAVPWLEDDFCDQVGSASKENNKLEAGLYLGFVKKKMAFCWPILFARFCIACICHDLRNLPSWKRTQQRDRTFWTSAIG